MNYLFLSIPIIIAFLVIVNTITKRKAEKFFFFIVTFIFSLIIGLRDTKSGFDTKTYVNLFNSLRSFEDIFFGYMSWKGDYFFTTITFLIKIINSSPRFYIFSLCLISISIFSLGIYRLFSENKNRFLYYSLIFLSFAPYLLFGNVIRQGLGTALLFLALSYYKDHKKRFAFILFCAILTHKSTLLFILFPIYYELKLGQKFIKILLVSIFLKALLINVLFKISFFKSKLIFYSDHFVETENILQIILILILLSIVLNKKLFDENLNKNFIYTILFFTISLSMMLSEFPKLSGRIFLMTSPILPFALIEGLYSFKQNEGLKVATVLFVFFISFYVMLTPQIQFNLTY